MTMGISRDRQPKLKGEQPEKSDFIKEKKKQQSRNAQASVQATLENQNTFHSFGTFS